MTGFPGMSKISSPSLFLRSKKCRVFYAASFPTTACWRRVPAPAEEDAQSEASEWELWVRREREEERRAEAEELGAEVEELLFLPTPASMASAEEE
jgi:hypothetical protein